MLNYQLKDKDRFSQNSLYMQLPYILSENDDLFEKDLFNWANRNYSNNISIHIYRIHVKFIDFQIRRKIY